ncbi:MAG: hypothetical protein C0467_16985 [Planctomycetaceae bacterium]|nr:hypothetical protein [Planctomycetaceae bacterium]
MITLDTILAALSVADPYSGIDQLIRIELANGRGTREIHDELFPLVREVRRSPELTEDASEALFGALDALTGNCHPDCRYADAATNASPTAVPTTSNGVHTPTPSEKV